MRSAASQVSGDRPGCPVVGGKAIKEIGMGLRSSVSAAGVVLVVVAALGGPAGAETRPVQRVSSGDPFAKCTIGSTDDGVSAPASEVEPWVAVDPRHPGRVIGAWQQDRWSDG